MIDVAATALALRQNRRNSLVRIGKSHVRRSFLVAAVILAAAAGGGWFAVHHMASAAPVAAAVQAVPVNTVTMEPQKAQIWSEFSGRLDAVDYAEIRPQVSGRITEIRFQDGQEVKAGDVLFVIDPRPFEAAVAKAAADLQQARTNASLAKANLARADSLKKAGAIALQSYDQAANASAVADAAIGAAQAALTQARLDVDHAYVKAPISGRVSRAEITVGNLVQAQNNAPLLTSIVSNNGIYADFDVDEQTFIRDIHPAAGTQALQHKIPVELTLPGGGPRVYKGFIESFDNHIDTGSGTIRARARFDNADGTLVPGMFVSVRMADAASSDVLLVPERALGTDQSKHFVFVVDGAGKATFREVTLGAVVDGKRVVTSGLSRGDKVIVDGIQHIQPGALVAARDISTQVAAQ
jgi:multidrug efflux system membrane fusion protein